MLRGRSCFRQSFIRDERWDGGESVVHGATVRQGGTVILDRDEFRSRKLGKYSKSRFKSFTPPGEAQVRVELGVARRILRINGAVCRRGVLYGGG